MQSGRRKECPRSAFLFKTVVEFLANVITKVRGRGIQLEKTIKIVFIHE